MKKNSIYALMSAIALAGSVGFSGCSSEEEVINNPNYDPETNSVKAQFAISLGDNVVGTRMSDVNTQAAGTAASFRGLANILLIPFKSGSAADANLNGKVIGLLQTDAKKTSTTLANDMNFMYENVDVKIGTNYFAFYAVADPGTTSTGFQVGRLSPTLPAANDGTVLLSNYKFAPVPIKMSTEYTDNDRTQADNVRDNLIGKLNQVLAVDGWKTSTNVQMHSLYQEFKGLRVGSSDGVQKALQNLYTKASAVTGDGATLAAAIKIAITANLTGGKGDGVTVAESGGNLTFGAGYNGYPGNIGLPNGSARLTFTDGGTSSADEFGAATSSDILLSTSNTTAPGKFVYPADLRYFRQTTIKTSNSAFLDNNINSNWTAITSNTTVYTGSEVDGNTRSIILTDPIQYGVGRLETSIAQMSGTYYDKDGIAVTIPEGGFTLTGVIIGGQKAVDWKFEPIDGGEVYTVYDSDITGISTSTTAASGINHTLVLQTKAEEEEKIALQFTNNSSNPFMGADGVIYPGQTFYLVGNLNPKTGGNGTPPTPAPTPAINQVFIQDYVTKAVFTIANGVAKDATGWDSENGNTTGFGAALSGLPDLTTVTMEFGLSVNLQWESGLTFNVGL